MEKVLIRNDVKNLINNVSGTYATPLLDKLFPDISKICEMRDIYSALEALIEADRIMDALKLIKGLFCVANMEYPYLMTIWENRREEQKLLLLEFMEDFYEFIEGCQLEM